MNNVVNLKNKNIFFTIIGYALVIFFVVLFCKLVIYDCIIGTKVYDSNDVVIRYHRYINIFVAKNNSNETIYMHYQHGRCRKDANLDKYKFDIKYYKKSENFEIKSGDKFVKFMFFLDDAYIFTIANDYGLYDSVSYNKHEWFKRNKK